MKFKSVLFAAVLATTSATALFVMLAPAPSEAATCMIRKGKWVCGGATLAAAKSACNVTTGNHRHTCDSGINVCTCATQSTQGPATDVTGLKSPGTGKVMVVKPAQ